MPEIEAIKMPEAEVCRTRNSVKHHVLAALAVDRLRQRVIRVLVVVEPGGGGTIIIHLESDSLKRYVAEIGGRDQAAARWALTG